MEGLLVCRDCGFVTRRGGEIGARGHCPHCEDPLTEAHSIQPPSAMLRKRERARAARAGLMPLPRNSPRAREEV